MRRAPLARVGAVLVAAALPTAAPAPTVAQEAVTYWVYVANESSDLVSRVRFDGHEAVEEKTVEVGFHPADLDGAHGLTVSPTGEHWYVSLAHGQPYGFLLKMETGTDAFVDSAVVGLFPASMSVTPDGSTLYVVNFNLHGDHVPSSVSAVFTPLMREIRQIETCVMPHGSRLSPDGARHYSTCMMSDQLVEVSTNGLEVARRFGLTAGHEGLIAEGEGSAHHGMAMGGAGTCKPTWVAVHPDGERLYVPCNGRAEVLEIDAASLAVLRKLGTAAGPYNAEVSPDGRWLVVTLKSSHAVALWDLRTGEERRVRTSRSLPHGIAITPDSRYAFVSNEAVGATRGTVDVIELASGTVAATAEVQLQPGGIGFWKMESRSR